MMTIMRTKVIVAGPRYYSALPPPLRAFREYAGPRWRSATPGGEVSLLLRIAWVKYLKEVKFVEEVCFDWMSRILIDTGNHMEVVSGMAPGVDTTAYEWAARHRIVRTPFPADWDTYGKSAGMRRNKEMGDYADELLAIWDGKSKGTGNMIAYMKSLGKPVQITYIPGTESNGK